MMKLWFAMHVPEDRPYTPRMRTPLRVNVVNTPQRDENVPISSMTGFASTSGQAGDSDWRWDVKSVNARGLDLRFRLPPGHESLEPTLRKTAQAVLHRGSILISLTTRHQRSEGSTSVDKTALSQAVKHIAQVRTQLESDGIPVAPTSAEAILTLPGIIASRTSEPTDNADAINSELLTGFEAAVHALVIERRAEGVQLARVITEQVTQIESLTRDAEGCAEEAILALRERFKTQFTALLSDTSLSEDRLAQESALLASKADVREEIDRLHAHIAAARELLSKDEPIGRRLDFLTQEFNRESNTLCSKSPTDELTRTGMELKTVIDQIKEQAANVE